ncbi:hypothetical protein YC2023_111042 [Brassica napus]
MKGKKRASAEPKEEKYKTVEEGQIQQYDLSKQEEQVERAAEAREPNTLSCHLQVASACKEVDV